MPPDGDSSYNGAFLSAPRFASRPGRSSGAFVASLVLAFSLAPGCAPEVTPGEEESGGTGGAGGSATGGAGGAMGGASTTGGSGGSGGAGGASGGTGGAGGSVGGAAGVGGAGAVGGVSAGGAAGAAALGGAAGAAGQAAGGDGVGGAAGSLATGGDAGTTAGGAGGSAGDSGSGGSSMPPMGFLIEDFEGGTKGQAPATWDTFIAWNKNGQNPSGDTLALIDDTQAHSGTKSVHFHGGANPAQITKPLPMGTTKLYVRAWIYQTRQLGMNPGANHETLIGIRKTTGGANDEVRFGEIKGVIGTNEVPTDNIAPKMEQWGMGPAITANAWHCFEVAFLADQAQHTLHAWVDGTLVHEITAGDQWQNGAMPAGWLNGMFVEVVLGWHSFSSATNDVWLDDLVLSNERIGCG
jgi:hypothetical protein